MFNVQVMLARGSMKKAIELAEEFIRSIKSDDVTEESTQKFTQNWCVNMMFGPKGEVACDTEEEIAELTELQTKVLHYSWMIERYLETGILTET